MREKAATTSFAKKEKQLLGNSGSMAIFRHEVVSWIPLGAAPTPTDIRHGMIRGGISGGEGCYRVTPNSVHGLPWTQVLGFPLE